MEFLHTKDPLFFSKPPTEDVELDLEKESLKLTFRKIQGEPVEQKIEFLAPYEDNDSDLVSCTELDDGFEILPTKNGQYLTTFHVPEHCYSHIIGAKGHKRRDIENATGAHIKIPKPGETDKEIVITGRTERAVASARNRVNMILLQLRERERPTHFISIPVTSNEITTKFDEFKRLVLYGTPFRGVDESIFQKPEKLHLTITTLVLWDDEEIQEAAKILNDRRDELWPLLFPENESFKIVLEGLEIMNDDPKDVHVLYAKVKLDPAKFNTNFQRFVNGIADSYVKRAYVNRQHDTVKLHATLMNSAFRVVEESAGNDTTTRKSFDASLILEKYKGIRFGTADLKSLHLSIRFQTGDDKYYKPECVVDL